MFRCILSLLHFGEIFRFVFLFPFLNSKLLLQHKQKQQENNDATPFIVLKILNRTRVTGKLLTQRKCSYSWLCMALGNSWAPFSFISTEAEKKEMTPFHNKVDIPKHILATSLKTCRWAAAL